MIGGASGTERVCSPDATQASRVAQASKRVCVNTGALCLFPLCHIIALVAGFVGTFQTATHQTVPAAEETEPVGRTNSPASGQI